MHNLLPPTSLVHLVARYHQPLERYARRLLLAKHRAPDIVKWVMEDLYDKQQFFDGPHFRPLLIASTKKFCSGLNKAVQISQTYQHPLDQKHGPSKTKKTKNPTQLPTPNE